MSPIPSITMSCSGGGGFGTWSMLGAPTVAIAIPAIAGIAGIDPLVCAAGFAVCASAMLGGAGVDGATSSSILSSSTGASLAAGVTRSATHPQRPSSVPRSSFGACFVVATARTRRSSSPHLIDSDRLCCEPAHGHSTPIPGCHTAVRSDAVTKRAAGYQPPMPSEAVRSTESSRQSATVSSAPFSSFITTLPSWGRERSEPSRVTSTWSSTCRTTPAISHRRTQPRWWDVSSTRRP